jgi:hypothetical protein
MELSIEKVRELREFKNVVVHPVYNTVTGKLEKVFNVASEAYSFANSHIDLKYFNLSNSLHCPRDIYLMLTPYTQLDFYLDGLLTDELTEMHDKLRKQVIERERKEI